MVKKNIYWCLKYKRCAGCGNKLRQNCIWYFLNDQIFCNKYEYLQNLEDYYNQEYYYNQEHNYNQDN